MLVGTATTADTEHDVTTISGFTTLGAGEVDETGIWSVQAQITGLDGWSGSAAVKRFVVESAS